MLHVANGEIHSSLLASQRSPIRRAKKSKQKILIYLVIVLKFEHYLPRMSVRVRGSVYVYVYGIYIDKSPTKRQRQKVQIQVFVEFHRGKICIFQHFRFICVVEISCFVELNMKKMF